MKETIAKINEVMAVLQAELAKAAEGNKAAAARARKATLELEKLGKEFRKQSIAELKQSGKTQIRQFPQDHRPAGTRFLFDTHSIS